MFCFLAPLLQRPTQIRYLISHVSLLRRILPCSPSSPKSQAVPYLTQTLLPPISRKNITPTAASCACFCFIALAYVKRFHFILNSLPRLALASVLLDPYTSSTEWCCGAASLNNKHQRNTYGQVAIPYRKDRKVLYCETYAT